MKLTDKVEELSKKIADNAATIEFSKVWGVLGPQPIPYSDEGRYGFTEKVIDQIINGGYERSRYSNSSIAYVTRGNVDEWDTQEVPKWKEKIYFKMLANMMTLAEIGVLDYENHSSSADLGRWRINKTFQEIMPEDDQIVEFYKALKTDKDLQKKVIAHLEKNVLGSLPDVTVDIDGEEVNLKDEVNKISIERLSHLYTPFNYDFDCIGLYLANTGRLSENNSLMALAHTQGGNHMVKIDMDDLTYDSTNCLVTRDSRREGIEYFAIDYEKIQGINIGDEVHPRVAEAVSALAMYSNMILKKKLEFNPYEPGKDASAEFKSRLVPELLDFEKNENIVRRQILDYLAG